MSNLTTCIQSHTGSQVLSALLDRYGIADVISALASVTKDHPYVPGGNSISADLDALADQLPTCAWRNP